MAAPEPGSAGSRELGGAPRDGDFARLLEAASAPAAHRMKVDPSAFGVEDATSRAARAGRFTGAPPARDAGARGTWSDDDGDAPPAPARPAAPYGPPGMAEGRTRAAPARGSPSGGNAGPVQSPAGLVAGWARRPLKDRIIIVLFGIAGLWILVSILATAARDHGDATGLILVIAVVVFFVLRGRSRRQPPPDAP
ncbi:MAG: hypothetical protein EHM87_08100 [Burkholderiales bacterium]|nr:MAG: hypothetical protein EHM87_08100 [Burkholderiales bacterium]